MANRNFNRVQAIDKEVKHIYGQFLITDGSGTTQFAAAEQVLSVGVKNVEHDSGGKFTSTLGVPGGKTDKYNKLLFASFIGEHTTHHGVNGGIAYQLNTLPSGTSSNDLIASDGQVKFMTLKDDGTLQDPKSGEVVRFHLIVKNSNQPGLGGS